MTEKKTSQNKARQKPRVPAQRVVCSICGKQKSVNNNFFRSSRNEYVETGYCDICKSCLMDIIVNPETGLITKDKFRNDVCFYLDIPFIPSLYSDLARNTNITKSNFIGEYKKLLNLNSEWKVLKYSDSSKFLNIADEALFDIDDEEVTGEMVEFWGEGHSAKYYLRAQRKYDTFMGNENIDAIDYKKQSDYKTLVQLELKKDEMMADPEVRAGDIKAISETISKISQDLNIKAIQKNEDKNNKQHYIIGLTVKWIEDVKKEPIKEFREYFKKFEEPEFVKDIQNYFFGPIAEELGINNPYKQQWEEDMAKYAPTHEEIENSTCNEAEVLDEDAIEMSSGNL